MLPIKIGTGFFVPFIVARYQILNSNKLLKPVLYNYNNFLCRTLIGTIKHCNKKEKPISTSSIILQDGLSILEMPCIIQVINGDFDFLSEKKTDNGESCVGIGLQYNHVPKNLFKNIDFNEESEMVLGFMKCNSMSEICNLLNTCPQDEITPTVALSVIRRIFELENNLKYRNEGYKKSNEELNMTFTRSALIKHLIDTICASSEPQVIVDALRSMGRDSNFGENSDYLEQICSECIILASDGKLNVNQVCDIIKSFQNFGNMGKEFAEKAWVGINEKQNLTGDELCNIIQILPLVKNSRVYLYNIVERKLPLVSDKLDTDHIIKIAYSLVQLKISSNRTLGLITRWTNLNIHKLTEGNLRWIVYSCLYLEYVDENIQKALSRYMKAKKDNIKDYSLVFIILEYCDKLRIRHPTILKYGSEYYIKFGKTIPASQSSIIMNCFGNLSYIPDKTSEFFLVLEHQINCNFFQFPPSDLLSMFLSCIYIQRYPINFVNKIFDSHFFDRMFSLSDREYLSCKEKLMILDTVLTLESAVYKGPLIPRSITSELSLTYDARAKKCINEIKPIISNIFGSKCRICSSYILPSLPSISLFAIDCFVDTTVNYSITNFKPRGKYALIILFPEYFELTEKHLLGPHELRKRIFEQFNIKVIGLKFNILRRLCVYPEKIKDYIEKEIQNSL